VADSNEGTEKHFCERKLLETVTYTLNWSKDTNHELRYGF
jgi:hypothetical protein